MLNLGLLYFSETWKRTQKLLQSYKIRKKKNTVLGIWLAIFCHMIDWCRKISRLSWRWRLLPLSFKTGGLFRPRYLPAFIYACRTHPRIVQQNVSAGKNLPRIYSTTYTWQHGNLRTDTRWENTRQKKEICKWHKFSLHKFSSFSFFALSALTDKLFAVMPVTRMARCCCSCYPTDPFTITEP